jgi:ribosomal protein S18 acetylase RimI-like enzyme
MVSIANATEPEREWAADLLAGTDPWITLGVSREQCLRNCQDPEFEVYIAHAGTEPCGVMILDPRGLAGSPYIKSVAVAESFRGFHVGAKLLEFTEDICRKRSRHLFLCVSSFNSDAQRFYKNHGFAVVGELSDYIIKGASETIMHKPL